MQAEGQVAMNAAALALYEWTHESDLASAGLLGAPIEVAPQVGALQLYTRPLSLLTTYFTPSESVRLASSTQHPCSSAYRHWGAFWSCAVCSWRP